MSNFANIHDASFRNGISCSVSFAVPSRFCVGITLVECLFCVKYYEVEERKKERTNT